MPAGNVCAIAGLETAILKSATLAGSPAALPLAPMTFQAAPIVRVALEPSAPGDMAALAAGLKLLNRWGAGGGGNHSQRPQGMCGGWRQQGLTIGWLAGTLLQGWLQLLAIALNV